MKTSKTNSKTIILNFGLALGFISIIIALINYVYGNPNKPHWIVSVVSTTMTAAIIVLAIKKHKLNQNGFISLKEALKTGLGVCLISGFTYVIFNLVLTNYIDPEFYTRALEYEKVKMIEQYPDMTDEQIDSSMAIAEKFVSPLVTSAFILIGSLFVGFIISLIAGSIMKKNNPNDAIE